jgi:internalin A
LSYPIAPVPKFLIPGLLPKDEPEETSLRGDTFEFQYHYRILPEGVLVSLHRPQSRKNPPKQVCWRSGVMLEYCEGAEEVYNIARIKADPEDRQNLYFYQRSRNYPSRLSFR